MDGPSLTSMLATCASETPATAAIYAVQQFSLDELRQRAGALIATLASNQADLQQSGSCRSDHGDSVVDDSTTTIRLAGGARAVLYHASGAVEYRSGLAPFEAVFARAEEREVLTRLVAASAAKIDLNAWLGDQGKLAFERLWQQKARGTDRSGKATDPVLTRVVGAFRHFVGGIPVLGGASVALRLAQDGAIDALTLRLRPSAGETIDKADIIAPELAARQLSQQLATLLGFGREQVPTDVIAEARLLFGYLDLGKRKQQELLAPAYVAQITLQHKFERQAYILAVPATQRVYQQLPLTGEQGLATGVRHCG
ncbi:MAG: hypothetical protein ACJ8HI_12930 [Massilia sp.]